MGHLIVWDGSQGVGKFPEKKLFFSFFKKEVKYGTETRVTSSIQKKQKEECSKQRNRRGKALSKTEHRLCRTVEPASLSGCRS